MAKPATIPEWNTGGTNNSAPTGPEQIAGWANGDAVPSSYLNWFQKLYGEWLTYLDELETYSLTWQVKQAVVGTEAAAPMFSVTNLGNGNALDGLANGTGVGVSCANTGTGAPLFVLPSAAPAVAVIGAMYVTTAGVLYICTNNVGPTWTKVGAQ